MENNSPVTVCRDVAETDLEGIAIYDNYGTFSYINSTMASLFGYSVEEVTGKSWEFFYPADQVIKIKKLFEHPQQVPYSGELLGLKKDGTSFKHNIVLKQLLDAKQSPVAVICLYRDDSQQKQALSQLQKKEHLFESMFDHSPIPIACLDIDCRYKMANKKYCEWVGISVDDIVGKHLEDVLTQSYFTTVQDFVDKVLQGEQVNFELRVPNYSGNLRWVNATYICYRDKNGSVSGFLAFINDIDEVKRDEQERLLLLEAVEHGVEGFSLHDADGNFSYVNSSQSIMYGYQPDELIGQSWEILHDAEQIDTIEKQYFPLLSEHGHWRGELRGQRKNGDYFDVEVSWTAMKNEGAGLDGWFCSCRDISERKRNQEEVDFLAYHDTLTGLPNRLSLKTSLEELLTQADENHTLVAVMFIDLDYFKHINDTLGHSIGDRLLKAVAERLQSILRDGDIVARLGGDEFTLLLPDLTDVYAVQSTLDKLMSAFRKPFTIDAHELFQSISMGISIYPKDAGDVETLMKHADAAMYSVKEHGRRDYRFYTHGLTENSYENLLYRSQLQKAIDNEEFVMFYQPLISYENNSVIGFESLIRWQHFEKDLVLPEKFIKYAEETNLVVPIGRYVLEKSCKQLQQWLEMNMDFEKVSINVSGIQLQEGFADLVLDIVESTNIEASRIELEITENFFLNDLAQALTELKQLRNAGIRVAIDDFGVGYSSLSQLKQLPIDRLKVDRSFVGDIENDADDRAIVEAIIVLGKTLKLDITAEGVEKIEQHKLLRQLGCQLAQGFYYSKPQPPEKVPDMVKSLNEQLKFA